MMKLIMITKRPANASQIPFILPSLTIQPKSSLSRLLTQRDPPCLQKTPPGLYHHDEFLSITVWRTLKGKIMLRLLNDSHQTVTIKFSQLRFHKPPSAVRINTLSVQRPHGDNQVSAEAAPCIVAIATHLKEPPPLPWASFVFLLDPSAVQSSVLFLQSSQIQIARASIRV